MLKDFDVLVTAAQPWEAEQVQVPVFTELVLVGGSGRLAMSVCPSVS